jgi:hypothetical protein
MGCTECLTEAVTTNGAAATPVTSQICKTCESGFFTFRRGCERCSNVCTSCTYNAENDWNNVVRPFWEQTLPKVKDFASSSTARRLLQGSFTEDYTLWDLAKYNAAKWTTYTFDTFANSSPANVKGWTEAYYFFKAVETKLPAGTTLDKMIYNCLPIMGELLNTTLYRNIPQSQHLAKFVNHFLTDVNGRWTGPTLNKKLVDIATTQASCTACVVGYRLENSQCVACAAGCATCSSDTVCSVCKQGFFLSG